MTATSPADRVEVQLSGQSGFVWSGEGVMRLRSRHRILGCLVGSGAMFPREEAGLPLLLSPQEIQVLLEEEVIKLVFLPTLVFPSNENSKRKAEKYFDDSYHKQIQILKNEKAEKIRSFADRIIEGKRKKLLEKAKKKQKLESGSTECPVIEVDGEKIIEEEISKIQPISREHQVMQIFTKDPWIEDCEKVEGRFTYPSGELNRCRLLAFKTLWNKGYYIGQGSKFGGDYLVYLGDPVKFHASYIVICTERGSNGINTSRPQDIVAKSRLGSQVQKTVLIAELEEDGGCVRFCSINRNINKKQITYHLSDEKDKESSNDSDNHGSEHGDEDHESQEPEENDADQEIEEGFEDEL